MFHNPTLIRDTCDLETLDDSAQEPNGAPINTYIPLAQNVPCRFVDVGLQPMDKDHGYMPASNVSIVVPAQYSTLKPRDRVVNISRDGVALGMGPYLIDKVTPRQTLLQNNVRLELMRDG